MSTVDGPIWSYGRHEVATGSLRPMAEVEYQYSPFYGYIPSVESHLKKAAIILALIGLAVWMWTVGMTSGQSVVIAAAQAPPPATDARRFFDTDERIQPTREPSSKGLEIDALVASGRPVDALAAFHITAQCKAAHDWERGFIEMPPPEPSAIACAGIMQRHLMDMARLLRVAVKAGVNGAVVAQHRFGPLDGDVWALQTRPDDPAVVEWQTSTRVALIEEARRTGNKEVLGDLSGSYLDGSLGEKNPELGLAYLLAYLELRLRIPGTKPIHDASLIAQTSRDLTQDQVNAAHRFARKLVDECCPKRKGK